MSTRSSNRGSASTSMAEIDMSERTNYALRENGTPEKEKNPAAPRRFRPAAPSRHGLLVRQEGLLNLADDLGLNTKSRIRTTGKAGRSYEEAGVKGIHIAERDTQRAKHRNRSTCSGTPVGEGFISEGLQPAELAGAPTRMDAENAKKHKKGAARRRSTEQPVQTPRAQLGPTPARNTDFLVRTTKRSRSPTSSPSRTRTATFPTARTCHYAYHPANDAVLSLHEMSATAARRSRSCTSSTSTARGRRRRARRAALRPCQKRLLVRLRSRWKRHAASRHYQNATGLQVTSAVLAGMVWALENPKAGIVEADEMDYKRCLEVQMPYLGPVEGHLHHWTPLDGRPGLFPEDSTRRTPGSSGTSSSAEDHATKHALSAAEQCSGLFFSNGLARRAHATLAFNS